MMNLKEVLQKLVDEGNSALLNDGDKISSAGDLLDSLSDLTLNRKAHIQPGLYIAEIDDGGYLGKVLYKFI
jgi:hypothetical protein